MKGAKRSLAVDRAGKGGKSDRNDRRREGARVIGVEHNVMGHALMKEGWCTKFLCRGVWR